MRDVRFTPRSGHVQRRDRCLLSAISRHRGRIDQGPGRLVIDGRQLRRWSHWRCSKSSTTSTSQGRPRASTKLPCSIRSLKVPRVAL